MLTKITNTKELVLLQAREISDQLLYDLFEIHGFYNQMEQNPDYNLRMTKTNSEVLFSQKGLSKEENKKNYLKEKYKQKQYEGGTVQEYHQQKKQVNIKERMGQKKEKQVNEYIPEEVKQKQQLGQWTTTLPKKDISEKEIKKEQQSKRREQLLKEDSKQENNVQQEKIEIIQDTQQEQKNEIVQDLQIEVKQDKKPNLLKEKIQKKKLNKLVESKEDIQKKKESQQKDMSLEKNQEMIPTLENTNEKQLVEKNEEEINNKQVDEIVKKNEKKEIQKNDQKEIHKVVQAKKEVIEQPKNINFGKISSEILIGFLKNFPEQKEVFDEQLKIVINRSGTKFQLCTLIKGSNRQYNDKRGGSNYNNNKANKHQKKNDKSDFSHVQFDDKNGSLVRGEVDPLKVKILQNSGNWIMENKKKTDTDEEVKLIKSTRLNLNKLTPENFSKLKSILLQNCLNKTDQQLQMVVNLIIEKSFSEKKYSSTYAELCLYINKKFSELAELTNKEEKKKIKNIFILKLLEGIQGAFDNYLLEEKVVHLKDMTESQQSDYFIQKKKRILGTVHFISDLFLQGVISRFVLWICSVNMIQSYINDFKEWVENGEQGLKYFEENLEGIMQIYEKTGEKLEKSKQEKKHISKEDFTNKIVAYLERLYKKKGNSQSIEAFIHSFSNEKGIPDICELNIYHFLSEIKNKEFVSIRLKCLIENFEEMRHNGWVHSVLNQSGPMKLKDVQKHEQKQPQKKKEIKASSQKKEIQQLSEDEIISKIKHIFRLYLGKITSETGVYVNKEYIEDLNKVYIESKPSKFIYSFFMSFFEEEEKDIEKIISSFKDLVLNLNFKDQELVKAFDNFVKIAYGFSCDNPKLNIYLEKMFDQLYLTNNYSLKSWDMQSRDFVKSKGEDDLEEYDFFLQDFFEKFEKTRNEKLKSEILVCHHRWEKLKSN